jgi:hypothetical protein
LPPQPPAAERTHDPAPGAIRAAPRPPLTTWTTAALEAPDLPLQPAPLAVPPPPKPAPAAASSGKAEFAVDVGGATNVDALRGLWLALTDRYPALDKLRPSVVLYDTKSGTPEMRLVLGPLPNVASASKLCASLTTAGVNCQTSVFDGQRMAWR